MTTGDIKIGLSDISGATITVGTASTATTINGTLTASSGITTNGPITVPTATYTPTISQIGYSASIASSNNSSITLPITFTTTGSTVLRVVNLPIGIYIATASFQIHNPTDVVLNCAVPVATISGATSYINLLRFNGPTSTSGSYRSCGVFTGGYQVTSSTNSYEVALNTFSGNITCILSYFSYTRIA